MLYYKKIDDSLNRSNIQHECVISLLKEAVLTEYGLRVSKSDILRTEYGKPYFPAETGIHFSLSHCSGLVVCLLSDKPCGADAEPVRDYRERVAARICSQDEKALLIAAEGDEKDRLFTSLWTLKEAYAKADGRGISVMSRAEFSFDNGNICSSVPYCFKQFSLADEGYIISICLSPDSTDKISLKKL